MIAGFQDDSGRSNSDGEQSRGIPKDIQGGSETNKGKSIQDWRAGRGSV